MYVGAVFVMWFMIFVSIVRRVFQKFVCVTVIDRVAVRMLLVGQMCSLNHSDHQGVIDYEQKCHQEFLVQAINLSCQWVGNLAL